MTDSVTASSRKRLSITKTVLQTTAGIELLQVLQSIADDGELLEDEVVSLRGWLANQPVHMPAHDDLS